MNWKFTLRCCGGKGLCGYGTTDEYHRVRISTSKSANTFRTPNVILLLVSPYFLASDYCYDVEMERALERHRAGEAVVIPVILDPCDWQNASFGQLRATPSDGKPVSKYSNIHDAFLEVTRDVRWAAEQLGKANAPDEQNREFSKRISTPSGRTSNLRVKKEFSDHERDTFRERAFEYIATFFENSLEELAVRNQEVDIRFKRSGESEFTAAVYINGDKKTSCRSWLLAGGGMFGGDIAYSETDQPRGSSFNASLEVTDDGYQLGLKPISVMPLGRRQSDEYLTPHGGAEYFWSILISPIQ